MQALWKAFSPDTGAGGAGPQPGQTSASGGTENVNDAERLLKKPSGFSGADATAMADYVRLLQEVYRRGGSFKEERQRRALSDNLAKAERFYERLLKK